MVHFEDLTLSHTGGECHHFEKDAERSLAIMRAMCSEKFRGWTRKLDEDGDEGFRERIKFYSLCLSMTDNMTGREITVRRKWALKDVLSSS